MPLYKCKVVDRRTNVLVLSRNVVARTPDVAEAEARQQAERMHGPGTYVVVTELYFDFIEDDEEDA